MTYKVISGTCVEWDRDVKLYLLTPESVKADWCDRCEKSTVYSYGLEFVTK